MKVLFESIEELTPNIKTFWFRPEKPVHYVAGQFTEMYLPHKADDRGQKRWFTISSSPAEDLISITTKFAHKSSSFKQELLNLSPGSQFTLAEPIGDFILPKDTTLPLIFVAGGIGITPYHSMIKWLSDKNLRRDITLFYSAINEQELVYTDLFESYGTNTHLFVGNPSPTWAHHSGHITIDKLNELADLQNSVIYFSGPEPMVESFVTQLEGSGIKKHRIVTDYFPGYQDF